jgi:hypothetical protein
MVNAMWRCLQQWSDVSRRVLGDLLTTWCFLVAHDPHSLSAFDLLFVLTPFLDPLRYHMFVSQMQQQMLTKLLTQLTLSTHVHDVANVSALTRLHALAMGLWGWKPTADEWQRVGDLVVQTLNHHSSDVHLVQSALSFVVLLLEYVVERENTTYSTLERVLTVLLNTSGEEVSTSRELLVFIALHAHLPVAVSRHDTLDLDNVPLTLLEDLIARTLRVSISLSSATLTRLQRILTTTSSLLPTHRLLHHLNSLPVTPRVSLSLFLSLYAFSLSSVTAAAI